MAAMGCAGIRHVSGTSMTETTDQMINKIEAIGQKRLGDMTEDQWRDYTALVLRCVQQMQIESPT